MTLREILQFPPGSYVRTPTGRTARVLGESDEGRLRLRYMGGDALDVVELWPRLCVRARDDEQRG